MHIYRNREPVCIIRSCLHKNTYKAPILLLPHSQIPTKARGHLFIVILNGPRGNHYRQVTLYSKCEQETRIATCPKLIIAQLLILHILMYCVWMYITMCSYTVYDVHVCHTLTGVPPSSLSDSIIRGTLSCFLGRPLRDLLPLACYKSTRREIKFNK